MSFDYSGERFIPGMPIAVELEHRHRYVLASQLVKGKRVLDVASGEGYGSAMLAQAAATVIGVDICSETVEHAQATYNLPNLEFLLGDCTQLPVDSASIDLVVSFETIEHHDQHEAMIREIERVLKPGGILIISSPNKKIYSDISGTHNQFHVKELYLGEFEALLRQAFPQVVFYGQRAALTSVIAPLDHTRSSFEWFCGSGEQWVCSNASDSAVYFLAIASKSLPLAQLPTSAFQINKPTEINYEISPVMYETKMFWRSEWSEKYDGYAENRSVAIMFSASAESKIVRLVFPERCGCIKRIRLDFLNALGGLDVHSMRIVAHDGRVIWKWTGDVSEFVNVVQAVIVPDVSGLGRCKFLSLGNDPWFELGLDTTLYEQIQPGCALILEVSPFHLLDKLPSIMKELFNNAVFSQEASAQLTSKFSDNLGSMATLIDHALSRRDAVIREQGKKLSQMCDELTRAEAQLDLLKDLMLGGRDEYRL